MEKLQSEVVLFGNWSSSYTTRVQLALKLKGIPYEFVQEDLSNKSEELLQYNPVHKKVPVLVHKGKPIAESLVILEYIDESWNHSPKLLPENRHQRAKVRFWANFYDQKVSPGHYPIILSKGAEQEKAIEQLSELLKVFEEGIERDFPQKYPFFNGDTMGFLDIIVGANGCNYEAFAEAVGVVRDLKKNPTYYSWVAALKECPLMKDTLPPHDKLVAKIKKKFFQAPSA